MLVLAISGYTKSKKSALARYLANNAEFEIVEMCDPIREYIKQEKGFISNVDEIIDNICKFRRKHGDDVLAKIAFERIKSSKNDKFVIVGLRSYIDHTFLKQNVKHYRSIFIHTTTEKRHQRLLDDPTSIAKNKEDFNTLDRESYKQGIINIANEADFFIINDDGFPLTCYEQMENVLLLINRKIPSLLIKDFNLKTIIQRSDKMIEKGYIVKKLPSYIDHIPENGEPISRVFKEKGELTNISASTIKRSLHRSHFNRILI